MLREFVGEREFDFLFVSRVGNPPLSEATSAYEDLVVAVIDGRLDPSQPVFRQDLED
jgi:hypothetical protein